LTCGVPDLNTIDFAIDFDIFGAEFDTDGGFKIFTECVIYVTKEDVGLSDAGITDYYIFEQIVEIY
jgi:hypothetical protein